MKKLIAALMCLLLLFGANAIPAQAATPKVIVAGYHLSTSTVYAGAKFNLTLDMKNTSKNKVKNMKVTLFSDGGEMNPFENTGSVYVEEIAGNEINTQTFYLKAADGLAEQTYKLTVKMEYEDNSGNMFEMSDVLYIPVLLRQRLSVSDVYSDTVKVGEDVEFMAQINNLGDGTLYNVSAVISGKHVEKQESYIGNVEPGKSGNIDILTRAIAMTEPTDVRAEDYLIVTYEDREGNKHEEQVDVFFSIDTVKYEDLEVIKEAPVKKGLSAWQIVLICGIVLTAGVFVGTKIRKHRETLI